MFFNFVFREGYRRMAMKNCLVILMALMLVLPVSAKNADSTVVDNGFRFQEIALPVSLVGVGALGFVEPVKNLNTEFNSAIADWSGGGTTSIDSYMEYLPMASVYAMSLLGADAKHNYIDRTLELATSYLTLCAITGTMKHVIKEARPDGSGFDSFPSGHTATAFMGAELIRIEYGHKSPLYTIGAYSVATAVGALRLYNGKHWLTDVVAGAGVGILSARIGYRLLPYTKNVMHRITGWDAFVSPTIASGGVQVGVRLVPSRF